MKKLLGVTAGILLSIASYGQRVYCGNILPSPIDTESIEQKLAKDFASPQDNYFRGLFSFNKHYKYEYNVLPRAVIILPTEDHNGVFSLPPFKNLVKKIQEKYNTKTLTAYNQHDMIEAISSTSNIALLFIAGHGDGKSVHFSNNGSDLLEKDSLILKTPLDFTFSQPFDEVINQTNIYFKQLKDSLRADGSLDTTDYWLENLSSHLAEDASVVLYSCSSGKYLGDRVKEWMGESKTVLGSTYSFTPSEVTVKSWFPFDINVTINCKCDYNGLTFPCTEEKHIQQSVESTYKK